MENAERADDRISAERFAIGICHAIYRNTDVEDYHAEDRLMDETLYYDVYQVVSGKVDLLFRVKNLLIASNSLGFSKMMNSGIITNTLEEKQFFAEILFGIRCGLDWDEPIDIDVPPTKDLAAYFLGGEFKAHCDGKRHFDDSVMKPINKDITNRVYRVLKEMILKNRQ